MLTNSMNLQCNKKMQAGYDGSRGIFQPLNIAVVGQVKCNKCCNFYSFSQIEEHLKLHINPKYLTPFTTHHKLSKMKVGIQNQSTQYNDTNIEISQMGESQFPNMEKNRKKVKSISPLQNDVKINTVNQHKYFPSIDKCQLTSNIQQNIFSINQPQILHIEKEIQIPLKQEKFNKRNINIYLQQKQTNYRIDKHTSNKKISTVSIQKKFRQPYFMLKNKMKQTNQQNEINMPVTASVPISFYRSPNSNIKIKTQSTILRKNFEDKQSYKEQVQKQIVAKQYGLEKCSCINCGGFYCKVCNSTVPPQYRPIKTKKVKQSQIRQFWSRAQRSNNPSNPSQNCQQCQKYQ